MRVLGSLFVVAIVPSFVMVREPESELILVDSERVIKPP